jgi:hypothetical protein
MLKTMNKKVSMYALRHKYMIASTFFLVTIAINIAHVSMLQKIMIPSHQITMHAMVQVDEQSITNGSFDSWYNFLALKFEQKYQLDLQAACHQSVRPIVSWIKDDKSHDRTNSKDLFDLKRIKQYIFSFFLVLFSSEYALHGMDDDQISQDIPVSRSYFSCIPANVRSLPVTLLTNLAGNGVANAIALLSPEPMTAAGAACAVGCAGGCLEAFSADTQYMSQKTIDLHRNFKTGFVADAVCVPVGSCFKARIPSAAAVGAPVGYCAGLGSGLVARKCCDHRKIAQEQKARMSVGIAIEPMER